MIFEITVKMLICDNSIVPIFFNVFLYFKDKY